MANDIELLNEAYSNMRQPINFAELSQMASTLMVLQDRASNDFDFDDDDLLEKLETTFWRKVRDAVKVFLAANNQNKRISAYAAEMSDSDVNDPNGIITLLKNPKAMMANYYEFLDACG